MKKEEIIKKAFSYLRSIGEAHTQQDVANKMGVSKTNVSRVFNGDEKYLTNNFLSRFNEAYNNIFNYNWLLAGEGEMLNNSIEIPITKIISNEEELKEAISKGIKLLPEVDFKFAAGQAELINGKEYIKRYWFLPDCQDCEAVAQISGSSMAPAYPSGCWIALKRYGFSLDTATQIPFGNVFGVVVEDQFTGEYHGHIKILRRYQDQILSHKYWIAHSLNAAEFDDFDVEITQVRSLWIVKQHIVSDVLL